MIFTFSQKAMSDSHDKETDQKKVDNTATVNEEPLPLNDPFAGDASTASDIVTEETPTSSAVKLRAYKLVGSFSAQDNSFITLVDDNGEFMTVELFEEVLSGVNIVNLNLKDAVFQKAYDKKYIINISAKVLDVNI